MGLVVAVVLGACVGLEREITDQPAGFRTHLTVALGAGVFGVISTVGFNEFIDGSADQAGRVDVTRVASNVVVGIGFLGAGVIFRSGSTVRNLTTAASLWVTAAIGLAAGVGNVMLAAGAAAGLLFALAVLRVPGDAIERRLVRKTERAVITLASGADPETVMGAVHDLDGVTVEGLDWTKVDGATVLVARLRGRRGLRPSERFAPLVQRDDIVALTTRGLQDDVEH